MTNKSTTETSKPRANSLPASGERLVYVMPQEAIQAFSDNELTLLDLWRILWRGKWLIVGTTLLFALLSIVYALTATEWYRAEVLLTPAEGRSTQALSGTLGGLASLAGVSVGGEDTAEALAVLRSRDFAGEFIEDLNLLPVFFADRWDTAAGASDVSESDRPDVRDGIKYFSNIRGVVEDPDTGLVTLTIEWKDAQVAARWANLLVARLNDRMRQRALKEAERNVAYLQSELGKTSMVTLQQSIGRLMESEFQKLMLARGNEEFAFRVVDQAKIPKIHSKPQRKLIVVFSTFVGGIMGVLVVLIRHAVRPAG